MKKIINYEERKKIAKRNQLIVGILLIFLMIFSTIGFAFNFNGNENDTEKIKYKDIEFVRDVNGYWTFNFNSNKFYTLYNPQEVSDIQFSTSENIEKYNNKPLYFVGNVGDGFSELYRSLDNYALRISNACLDKECKENYPIKNCDSDNIIIIRNIIEIEDMNIKEEIISEKNCVYITVKKENEAKYADAYLFSLLDIK
ncbi:MAG: hypothetical protein AABW83_00940 [Nanoarchaeota archaeon]